MKTAKDQLNQAYDFCLQIAQSHYENFPVASILLPKRLRRPIAVIYAFARTADDIADEGNLTSAQRLEQLEQIQNNLDAIGQNNYQGEDPVFLALAYVIAQHQLPINLLSDLLAAFKQDVTQKRYQDWHQILNYCQYSANPIGRLLLHLNQSDPQMLFKQSDAICTSLQLINFFQDIEQDLLENNRLYLPVDNNINKETVERCLNNNNSTILAPTLRHYFDLTLVLLKQGYLLGTQLNGRMGWEIRSITLSAIFMLKSLVEQTDDNLLSRPRIKKRDLMMISICSLSKPLYYRTADKMFNQISQSNKT